MQFEFLSDFIVQETAVLFTKDPQGAMNHVVKILAEAWQDNYWNETNKGPLSQAVKYLQANAADQF